MRYSSFFLGVSDFGFFKGLNYKNTLTFFRRGVSSVIDNIKNTLNKAYVNEFKLDTSYSFILNDFSFSNATYLYSISESYSVTMSNYSKLTNLSILKNIKSKS
jgi:hypothetical protein